MNLNTIIRIIFFSAGSLICCKNATTNSRTNSGNAKIQEKILVRNLTHPWEILWGPDNFIWMTERDGRISRVNPSNGKLVPLITIGEVESNGEGGLLGMALHPDFNSSPYVYVAYDYDRSGSYKEKIVRYRYNGNTLINPVTLLDNIAASGIHNGCRLLIIHQKLFITTGDASDQSQPQNKNVLNGKILRLNLDGSIPSDNPFPGNPVWSYGHRNPQGLVYANNILYSSEHGPDTDDEVNIIEKGRNYGWPNVKGYCNSQNEKSFCTDNKIKEPIIAWTPTLAVCGMDYYNGNRIPEWKNSLLLTTLKNSRLYQLKLNNDHTAITETNEFFKNSFGRLRDICISPDGKVYISTSNGNDDKIIVISER